MSCPVWDLPEFDREHWDLQHLCDAAACPECTAEPGEMPWMPDADSPPTWGERREC